MSQFSWIRMKMGIKEKLLEHLPGDRRRTQMQAQAVAMYCCSRLSQDT